MERTVALEEKIKKQVYEYFANECEINIEELNDDSKIIDDLDGDSLMFLQLLEKWKKEYQFDIEFRDIGRYLTKKPADTLGKTVDMALTLICDSENFKKMVS